MQQSDHINVLRFLSADAVQKANSGHPGMPMGMAEIATALWSKHLRHNPKNPTWFNRDRFVLSNGHGSMLLYSLLHLTGYDLSINDIKDFRKLKSKTPGHPEYDIDIGIDIDIRAHNRTGIESHPMVHKIEMIEGSSISPEVVTHVKDIAKKHKRILIFLDSNHTHDHVLAELEAYAPLTSLNSYCVKAS